jgi:hypothetical protein
MAKIDIKLASDAYDRYLIGIHRIIKAKDLEFSAPDAKEFSQVFGKNFQAQLSETGKIAFTENLTPEALKQIKEEFDEELKKNQASILTTVTEDFRKNLDPHATVKSAQDQLTEKLEQTKTTLRERLTTELTASGQILSPEDKEELESAVNNYIDKTGKKLNGGLEKLKSLPSHVAKLLLHQENAAAQLNATKSKDTFRIKELPEELLTGIKPDPAIGFVLNKDNLTEQMMHTLADLKPGEKIDLAVTIPNRDAIYQRAYDISMQYRNPLLGFLLTLICYGILFLRNNDEKRAFEAIKKVITEKGIMLDPKKITLKISCLNNNGDKTIIREGALNSTQIEELELANTTLRTKLETSHQQFNNKHSPLATHPQPESGYNSDEDEMANGENSRTSSPRP